MLRRTIVCVLFVICMPLSLSAQQWQSLFDGQSFANWTRPDGSSVDAPAWEVVDGMLHLDRKKGSGGNLVSEQVYGDFELMFEWKVAEGANNGIKYRVNDFDGRMLGLEYQVIDDQNKPKLKPKHKTASIYDIYETKPHSALLPTGEFNRGRIVVRGNRLEHWLNGHLVAEATVGSEQWHQRIAESKFSDVPGFGVVPVGRIMITDHKDEVWYRNIFVRRLDVRPATQQQSVANVASFNRWVGQRNPCLPCSQPRRVRRLFR